MTAAVIKLSDKHKLLAGEQCGHCNLKAPSKPKCWWCGLVMEDWPDDARQFLLEHDWEFSPACNPDGTFMEEQGYWIEPVARCSGPVTEEMLDKANRKLALMEKTLGHQFVSGKVDGQPRDEIWLTDATAGLELAKHELGILQEAEAIGGVVQIRKREEFPEREAVRMQLNDALPPWKTERQDAPMFSKEQIDGYKESVARTRRLSQEDMRHVREMEQRKQVVHHDRCQVCLR